MSQQVECPNCGAVLRLKDDQTNRVRGVCPKCRQKVLLKAIAGKQPVQNTVVNQIHEAGGDSATDGPAYRLIRSPINWIVGCVSLALLSGLALWLASSSRQGATASNSPEGKNSGSDSSAEAAGNATAPVRLSKDDRERREKDRLEAALQDFGKQQAGQRPSAAVEQSPGGDRKIWTIQYDGALAHNPDRGEVLICADKRPPMLLVTDPARENVTRTLPPLGSIRRMVYKRFGDRQFWVGAQFVVVDAVTLEKVSNVHPGNGVLPEEDSLYAAESRHLPHVYFTLRDEQPRFDGELKPNRDEKSGLVFVQRPRNAKPAPFLARSTTADGAAVSFAPGKRRSVTRENRASMALTGQSPSCTRFIATT